MGDYLGKGWAFPPRPDGRGGIGLVVGNDDIARAILIILSTSIGQRVMRSTFGSRLHELVFADLNAETLGLAEMYVKEALGFWEPRIEIVDVHAEPDPGDQGIMNIAIAYRVKATHDERSLVYPFYRIPRE